MRRARLRLSPLAMGLAALVFFACPDGGDSPKDELNSLTAETSVAQIMLKGDDFKVRLPGEVVFEPWKKEYGPYLPRGVTVQSGSSLATFNFMRSVTIQLSPNSVLILQGAVDASRRREFVLGLQEGEVWVDSRADYPLVVKMPHGEARGMRSVIRIENMRWDAKGGHRATVHALSTNVTVSNDHGRLTLPNFGFVRLAEGEPPALLQERGPGGRRLPRVPRK